MKLWKRVCLNNSSNKRIALFIALFVPLFSQHSNAEVTPSVAKTQSCYLKGISDRLQCGKLSMPENPEKPQGKKIDVHFAILPAVKNTHPQEAMLAIAGGPGQSAIDNAAFFDKVLSKVRENRDVLLIDQRGTGRSNLLTCDEGNLNALAYNDDDIDMVAETQKCLDKIKNKSDITQYTSDIALKDFDAIREHLGYQKLHLYGVSYGTRMAQLYMRHYPQNLATVTLDGIVPMQHSVLSIGEVIDRAVKLLMKDCADSNNCHQAFPTLEQDLISVTQRLKDKPFNGKVSDPYTGEQTDLLLTQNKFLGSVRLALYSTSTRALLPYAIHQAAIENYQPILGLYSLTVGGLDLALGMHSSIVCAEDLPRVTAYNAQKR